MYTPVYIDAIHLYIWLSRCYSLLFMGFAFYSDFQSVKFRLRTAWFVHSTSHTTSGFWSCPWPRWPQVFSLLFIFLAWLEMLLLLRIYFVFWEWLDGLTYKTMPPYPRKTRAFERLRVATIRGNPAPKTNRRQPGRPASESFLSRTQQ